MRLCACIPSISFSWGVYGLDESILIKIELCGATMMISGFDPAKVVPIIPRGQWGKAFFIEVEAFVIERRLHSHGYRIWT